MNTTIDVPTTTKDEAPKKKIVFSASVDSETADAFRSKVKAEGRKVSWVIEKLMELYLVEQTPVNIDTNS